MLPSLLRSIVISDTPRRAQSVFNFVVWATMTWRSDIAIRPSCTKPLREDWLYEDMMKEREPWYRLFWIEIKNCSNRAKFLNDETLTQTSRAYILAWPHYSNHVPIPTLLNYVLYICYSYVNDQTSILSGRRAMNVPYMTLYIVYVYQKPSRHSKNYQIIILTLS